MPKRYFNCYVAAQILFSELEADSLTFGFPCSIDSMRIILRKGHIGLNFYFIYSGSVFINVDDVNAKGESFVKTEVVLSRGDAFGVILLLFLVA